MTFSSPVPGLVSLYAQLKAQADSRGGSAALLAPGRAPLGHGALLAQVEKTARALRAAGVQRQDRVALVLPNGPEMAVAFIATAACATSAPLNPAYRTAELELCLSDLKARALIVQDRESPAIEVARRMGIRVLFLEVEPGHAAGEFSLDIAIDPSAPLDFAEPDDVALALHTSGTTARPKLVPLTQRALCISAHNIASALRLSPQDRCLNVMPLFHIHALIGMLLSSLSSGASIICAPGFQAPRFFEWLSELQPTWYSAGPSIHHSVIARAATLPGLPPGLRLRFIKSASAPLSLTAMAELESIFGVPVVEAYGMTEASSQLATNPLPPAARKPGAVGVATGAEIAIADDEGAPAPRGARGEIIVRGPSITLGYADNPEANAACFRDGWLRTGDQGYLDEDGYLFITGRLKEQINRAGEKISPREIDEALLRHPAVAEAVTFAMPDEKVGEEVAAAVVLKEGAKATERELQTELLERLADFKVPRRIVVLGELPKGPTGKTLRAGLAEWLGLDLKSAAPTKVTTPPAKHPDDPTTPTEREVAKLWMQVLGNQQALLTDNFFYAGGDSILAGQLLTAICRELGVALSFVDMFQGPTLKTLAASVDSARRAGNRGALPPIDRAPAQSELPLSLAQQRLWFVEQLYPGLPAYNLVTSIRLTGPLRIPDLEQAMRAIVARHQPLRARFISRDGVPAQIISASVPVVMPVIDLRGFGEAGEEQAARLTREEAWRRFRLEEGPVFRCNLMRLRDDEYVFTLAVHHIAFDAWSRGIVLRELAANYQAACAGGSAKLAPLPIEYGDYIHWQHHHLQGDALAADVAYWKQHLGDEPPALELPLDHPRPPVPTFAGRRLVTVIPPELRERMKMLSDREGATVAMIFLAVIQVLMHRLTQRQTIVLGMPIAGRNQGETEGLVGLFVNELLVRQDLTGDESFKRVLAKTRESMLGAHGHQNLPFDSLVQILRPARTLSRSPLFQVAFNHTTSPGKSLQFGGGLEWESELFPTGTAPFELLFDVNETPESLTLRIIHSTDVYDDARIDRMARQICRLLEAVCAEPNEPIAKLPVLGGEELARLCEWNKTSTRYPRDESVVSLFEAEAVLHPDDLAVEMGTTRLSYRELNERANRLARHLQAVGVLRGDRVGLCLTQSPHVIVAMTAILKAGAAYVPLDPAIPAARKTGILQDTAAKVLISETSLALAQGGVQRFLVDTDAKLLAALSAENLGDAIRPEDVAYVMYTSGSTGKPKGIAVPHRGIVRTVLNTNYVAFKRSDRVAQVTTFSFDLSTFEIWGALLNGAKLIQITKELVLQPDKFADELQRNPIDVLILATALYHLIAVDRPAAFGSVRDLLVCGEALDPGRARDVLTSGNPPKRLINAYGPTENSVFSTWQQVNEVPRGATQVPIGHPISNSTCWVLDKNKQLLPIGAEGELYLGGDGLALGYWNRPEENAACFGPAQFAQGDGEMLYKSGDRCRYRDDGAIEFLGRNDDQVKIRGFRIEPREIEVVLREHKEVEDAAVLVFPRGSEKRLGAFVRIKKGSATNAAALKTFLGTKVPEYMVPAEWTLSDALPLTVSGKIDRKSLPTAPPAPERNDLAALAVEPVTEVDAALRNEAEAKLTAIWQRLLGLQRVSAQDDFFEIGGHSLLAVRMVSEIEKAFRRRLPVAALIQAPTIAQLAKLLEPEAKPKAAAAKAPRKEQEKAARPALRELDVSVVPAEKQPLFCVATFPTSPDEVPALAYRHFASALASARQLEVLQPPELIGTHCQESILGIARQLIHEMKSIQPRGPYRLAGYCVGGEIAYEMASELQARGEQVTVLLLLEAINQQALTRRTTTPALAVQARGNFDSAFERFAKAGPLLTKLRGRAEREGTRALIRAGWMLCRRTNTRQPELLQALLRKDQLFLSSLVAETLQPRRYYGKVVVVSARDSIPRRLLGPDLGWSRVVSGQLELREVSGDHEEIVKQPQAQQLLEAVKRYLD